MTRTSLLPHPLPVPVARRRPLGRAGPGPWPLLWAGCAVAALLLAVVTDEGPHRVWGLCATIGYVGAGAMAAGASSGLRQVAPFVAAVGAAVVPMVWLVAHRQGQLEVDVVHHSGVLLLHTGSPYLPEPSQLEDYNPYLPAMALFGLPYALFGDSPLTDARWGFALVFGLALVVAARIAISHCAPRALALLAAFSLLALPLATGGIDLLVTALMCLALATAAVGRPADAARRRRPARLRPSGGHLPGACHPVRLPPDAVGHRCVVPSASRLCAGARQRRLRTKCFCPD